MPRIAVFARTRSWCFRIAITVGVALAPAAGVGLAPAAGAAIGDTTDRLDNPPQPVRTGAEPTAGAGIGDTTDRLDNPPQPVRIGAEPAAGSVAPYATTPMSIVDEMLQLANAGPGDYVVDLGSGDGRLVIQAVKRFNVRRGLGVDLDAGLVRHANDKAREAGVTSRASFEVRDLFDTDLQDATVVTIYLLPGIMGKLQDKLLAELPAGTRVVSHDYPFPSWPIERVRSFDVPEKDDYTGRRNTSVYLYTVPARPPGAAPARS